MLNLFTYQIANHSVGEWLFWSFATLVLLWWVTIAAGIDLRRWFRKDRDDG